MLEMMPKEPFDGGRSIVEKIRYPVASDVGWFSGRYDLLNTASTPDIDEAEFEIRYGYVPVSISTGEQLENMGKERILSLMDESMNKAEYDWQQTMGTLFYGHNTGGTGMQIDGCDLSFDDGVTYPTYGGINKTVWAFWAGNIQANAGVGQAWTMARFRTSKRSAKFGKPKLDMCSTSGDVVDKILSTFDGQRELKTDTLKAGFKWDYVVLDGIKIYVDDLCPTDAATRHRMYGFTIKDGNQTFHKIRYHKNANFKWRGWKIPENQEAMSGRFLWVGNHTHVSPRRTFRRDDIDPAL